MRRFWLAHRITIWMALGFVPLTLLVLAWILVPGSDYFWMAVGVVWGAVFEQLREWIR